jgi:hypothetical protein
MEEEILSQIMSLKGKTLKELKEKYKGLFPKEIILAILINRRL